MKNHLLPFVIVLLSTNFTLAQEFKSIKVESNKILTVVPSYTDPVVTIKDSAGELIKNVKVPEDRLMSLPTKDGKYLIVWGKEAIHRVAIYKNEIISVPYVMMNTKEDGSVNVNSTKYPIVYFTQGSNKYYLYDKDQGTTTKSKINIYEVDFTQETFLKYMSVPVNSKQYSVAGSFYNKYLIVCSTPGEVNIYDIENKTLFKSLKFEISEVWGDRAVDSYISSLTGSDLFYWMSNYGLVEPAKKAAFKVSYDMTNNKIIHQEFRAGVNAGTIYLIQPETNKIIWIKDSNREKGIAERTKKIFDDKDLSNKIFEFTGALGCWFSPKDPNLILVSYYSGKIETYDLKTKKLISSTKKNVMSDF